MTDQSQPERYSPNLEMFLELPNGLRLKVWSVLKKEIKLKPQKILGKLITYLDCVKSTESELECWDIAQVSEPLPTMGESKGSFTKQKVE